MSITVPQFWRTYCETALLNSDVTIEDTFLIALSEFKKSGRGFQLTTINPETGEVFENGRSAFVLDGRVIEYNEDKSLLDENLQTPAVSEKFFKNVKRQERALRREARQKTITQDSPAIHNFSSMDTGEITLNLMAHYLIEDRKVLMDILPMLRESLIQNEQDVLWPSVIYQNANLMALQLLDNHPDVNLSVSDDKLLISLRNNEPVIYQSTSLASLAYFITNNRDGNWSSKFVGDNEFRQQSLPYLATVLNIHPA